MPPDEDLVVPRDRLLVKEEARMRLEGRDAHARAAYPVFRVDALVDYVLDGGGIDVDRRALLGRRRREGDADLLGTDGEIDLLSDLELLVVVCTDIGEAFGPDGAVVAVLRNDLAGEEVGVADERGDEAGGRGLVYLGGAVELLDAAAVDHRYAVGERHRLALVVRHVHERDPDLVVDRVELEKHVLAQLEVERGERLVQEQDLRAVDEGPRYRDTLLLAARKLVRILPRMLAHLYHVEYGVDLLLDLLLRKLREPERERDVVPDRHRREEGVVLKHRVDAALVRRKVGDVPAFEVDAPGIGLFKAAEHPEERRLAAAGRTEKREKLPLFDGKRDVVDRCQRAKPLRHVVEDEKFVAQFWFASV